MKYNNIIRWPSISAAALALIMGACSSDNSTNTFKGVITDATMNTVAIASEGNDTLSFSTENCKKQVADGVLLGDSIEVTYKGKYHPGISALTMTVYPRRAAGNGSGEMSEQNYTGILPSASGAGIIYSLQINNPDNSKDGNFHLTLKYKEGEKGKDKTFTYSGKCLTLKGIPGNSNASVWQCINEGDKETFNFLRENDSTLILLSDKLELPKTDLNYTLTKVKK